MKIALVEDNGLHQAKIRQEIQNYFDELNEVCELHVFDNGSDMLEHSSPQSNIFTSLPVIYLEWLPR